MAHQLLKGKRGLIFGALDEHSLAWAVAEACSEEGAKIVLTNTALAIRMGSIKRLSEKIGAPIIEADATNMDDLKNLFEQSEQLLGGKIDFILHAVGMSMNIRRNKDYPHLNYSYYEKTLDISALSLHKMLQTAYEMDAIAEYGSVVSLTYIAAERAIAYYNDMADAKALLQSITRNFGLAYGQKRHVRINTVSQSPTKTKAGGSIEFFDRFFDISERTAPLGNASAKDCANFCVVLFSDYTRKITMQNLYHDGGFSTTGVQMPE